MKTFIINLERSYRRRQHILREVEAHKLDYELIKAVDGALLSQEEIGRLIDTEAAEREPQKLTHGSLGCLLSHLLVYERMLKDDLEMALVLEDDAILPRNILELLEDIEQNIANNEVVLLYFYSLEEEECEISQQDVVVLRNDYKLMYPLRVEQPVTALAYIITREAARSLLASELPMKMQCDEWGYFYRSGAIGSFRCIYPRAARFSGAKSIIQCDVQSHMRVKLTRFLDENTVPFFSCFLRKARLIALRKKHAVRFVDKQSPVAKALTR